MPNRIIKESICTSENVDQLTEFQEVFFYRLMVNCDDYGRFDARAKLLSSRLFPLRDVPTETIADALRALRDADLIIVYEVGGHPYLQMKTWEKHQQARATKSKYPSPDESDSHKNDSNCNQLQSDDSKCLRIRNRIRNTIIDNRNRETRAREDDDDDARRISDEHRRILDAAEDAGFKCSPSERTRLIDLYALHGLDKVLAGIDSCVMHSAPNLAYLEACMTDQPKRAPCKQLPAQNYEQRDYTGEQDAAMRRMMQME